MTQHAYTWGVDIGIKRVDVATIGPGVVNLHQIGVEQPKNSDRADKLTRLQLALIPQFIDLYLKETPFSVWVEQPAGFARNITLVGAYSQVLVALRLAFAKRPPFPVPIYSVTPSQWKKAVVGHGDASKLQVAAWAEEHGIVGDQDAIDAYCVARHGEQATARARGE